MSIIGKLFRSNPFNNPAYPMTLENVNAFLDAFGGGRSDSGELVNTATALNTSTVWACVNLISTQIAINPFHLYELDDKGNKNLAGDHDYYDLLFSRPNPEQDSTSFRTAVEISSLLHGNGFIEIQRDNGNRAVALWHRSALETVIVRMPNGALAYEYKGHGQEPRIILADDMINVMGMTLDGFNGLSVLQYHRQALGKKIALDKYTARFFANNATPSGILSTVQKVKPEDKTKMRDDWESLQLGSNRHRTAILDQELKFQSISIPQNDSQFLETLTEAQKEIAAIFGVPGYAVGLLEKGIKANVEQQNQDLYNLCLRTRMAKWEKSFTNKLFPPRGRSSGRYVAGFDVFNFLHPDSASLTTSCQSGIQNGMMSPNEGRARLGMNSIGALGDAHYIQLNMQTLAAANAAVPATYPADANLLDEEEMNSIPRLGANYRGLFKDGIQRLLKTPTRDYKAVYRCLWPTIDALASAARSTHTNLVEDAETLKAVEKLIEGMERRAKKWDAEQIDSILEEEMKRVAKALIFSTNADAANQKSKQDIAELEDEAEQENE